MLSFKNFLLMFVFLNLAALAASVFMTDLITNYDAEFNQTDTDLSYINKIKENTSNFDELTSKIENITKSGAPSAAQSLILSGSAILSAVKTFFEAIPILGVIFNLTVELLSVGGGISGNVAAALVSIGLSSVIIIVIAFIIYIVTSRS